MEQHPQLRSSSVWRDDAVFIPTFQLVPALPVDRELWNLLRSYSEVRSRGYELLDRYKVPSRDRLSVWRRFRSYIRQAENYWDAASTATSNSSSLLYYYSYLNLVKAYLLLKNPALQHKMKHGLSFDTGGPYSGLRAKVVKTIYGSGQVFPLYYKSIFSSSAPRNFRVLTLFSYLNAIGFQFADSGFGKSKSFPIIYRTVGNPKRSKSWIVLAIPSVAPISYFSSSFPGNFSSHFEQISRPQSAGPGFREVFGFRSLEWGGFSFYQSKTTEELNMANNSIKWLDHLSTLHRILGKWLEPNYRWDQFSAYLNFPKSRKEIYLMNGEVANYLLMFFMSELVRYRPDYLDFLLDSKAAWLLVSFVESCPASFLHSIVFRITGKVIAFE